MRSVITDEMIKTMIDLYNKEYTVVEVANFLNISDSTVSRYLRQNGIIVEKISDRKAKQVCELYLSGLSEENIGQIVGFCRTTVRRILRRNNIQIRTPDEWLTKYPVNENYFDIIDTQNKAYILGFYYADGNVNDKTLVQIALQSKDLHILESIKKEFGCIDRPLVFDNRSEKNIKHQDIFALSIKNQGLHDGLVKHGVVPNKTHFIKYPDFLSDDLHRHFIRGVLDGDGCIHGTTHQEKLIAQVEICGTYDLCTGIQNIVEKELKIYSSVRLSQKGSNTYKFVVSGRDQCITFLDWIYYDAELFLFRKYETYLSKYKNVA